MLFQDGSYVGSLSVSMRCLFQFNEIPWMLIKLGLLHCYWTFCLWAPRCLPLSGPLWLFPPSTLSVRHLTFKVIISRSSMKIHLCHQFAAKSKDSGKSKAARSTERETKQAFGYFLMNPHIFILDPYSPESDSLLLSLYSTFFSRFHLLFPQFLGAWRVPLRGL